MEAKNRLGEEIEEYLSLKGKTTRGIYSSAFVKFLEFYHIKHGEDKEFGDFLDCIFAESKKSRREQKRVAELELVDFIDYLKDKGLSNNSIRLYFAAIQNFLKYKQITVSGTFIGNMPPPTEKRVNQKHEWAIGQISEFVDSAPNYRDKAIIACLFQSGLDVGELTELNYGDIQRDYDKGIIPICLELVRKKTDMQRLA